jgi:hypothetical protein
MLCEGVFRALLGEARAEAAARVDPVAPGWLLAFLGKSPASRNPSQAKVSKCSVLMSKSTSDAGPNPAWAAHAAASSWRHDDTEYIGSRRFIVA